MKRTASWLIGGALLLLGAGEVWSQSTDRTGLLSDRQLMRMVVNPAAELFWSGGGVEETEAGSANRAPVSDERWTQLANAAAVLQESGNLLAMDARARDADWTRFAKQMNAAGAQALAAAQAKDQDKMFEAGSAVYDACYACHGKFIVRPANSLYKQNLPDDAFKPPM
jgi:hypothetical protein